MTRSAKTVGRILGVLFLVQSTLGAVANFALLGPAMSAPPGFLTNAAAHSVQVTVAALLLLAAGALSVGAAITAFPVFRRHSNAMALWYLALAVVGFSGLAVEGIALRSMLALSQEYAASGAVDAGQFQALGAVVRSLRNSAHYTNLFVSGVTLVVFYSVLMRFALVPRVLSAFGLATVASLIAGALIPLFGYPTVMLMFMPMGLSHLALALWLVVRGFEERHQPGAAGLPAAV
jgi:hypothetical protein